MAEIIDARSIEEGTIVRTDVCVVGAGAAGITLARELIGTGVDVVLLESGGFGADAATQKLLQGENVGELVTRLDEVRQSGFGGTTTVWNGACRPLDDVDFTRRDWIPHSGWPFSKAELDPFYVRAQVLCQLGPYCYDVASWQEDEAPALPLEPTRIATHIFQISPPTRFGRAYRASIQQAPNVRTYLFANVLELETCENGRAVTSVRVATLRGLGFRVVPRVVVLACGGIETPRLLLLSNRVQKSGLGNHHDLVGRFYSDHLRIDAGVLTLRDSASFRPLYSVRTVRRNGHSVSVEGLLAVADQVLASERMVRCAFHAPPCWRSFPEFQSDGVWALRELARAIRRGQVLPYRWPHRLLRIARDLDDVAVTALRWLANAPNDGPERVRITAHGEQAPNPCSRVCLGDARDQLGRRVVRLDWRLSEVDTWTLRRATELLDTEMRRAGVGQFDADPDRGGPGSLPSPVRGACHHMGTARMHPDSTRGVVDTDARVHDVANLFVAGSAVFPTGGYANPTLTIVALTLRLADHLKKLLA